MPDTNLTCVRTDKFKTCCLSLSLVTKLDRDTASKNALLPRVLLRGTSSYPDMERVNNYLDALYGARILPMVRKKGEKHCVGFPGRLYRRRFCANRRKPPGKDGGTAGRNAAGARHPRGSADQRLCGEREKEPDRRDPRRRQRQAELCTGQAFRADVRSGALRIEQARGRKKHRINQRHVSDEAL